MALGIWSIIAIAFCVFGFSYLTWLGFKETPPK
jgi:hypothetical protein